MKPLYLTMSAFGSYTSKTDIDFTRLGSTGIYLISGDTGSGKSTIFDAIAYALYGEASTSARGEKGLRSDAADAEETYVSLKFEHMSKVYTVRRAPEQDRKKARGNDTKRVNSAAQITLPDGSVIEGVKRVDTKVREILILDSRHFKSIMMIAQGDFAKLLTANSADREEILTGIFDTKLFEDFQRQAQENSKQIRLSWEGSRDKLLWHFDRAITDDIPDKDVYKAGEFAATLEKIVSRDNEEVAQKRAIFTMSDKRAEELTGERANAININAQFNELDLLTKKQSTLDLREKEINEIKAEIDAAARAARATAFKTARDEAKRQRDLTQASITDTSRQVDEIETQIPAYQKSLDEAEAYRVRYEEMSHKAKSISSRLEAYKSLETNRKTLQSLKRQIDARDGEITKLVQTTGALSLEKQAIEAEREALLSVPGQIVSLEAQKSDFERLLGELETLKKDAKEIAKLEKAYLQSTDSLKAALSAFHDASAQYEALNASFMASQAGILAEGLTPGVPCPVCGSISHPRPAVLKKSDAGEDDVNKAKKLREDADSAQSKISKSMAADKAKLDEKRDIAYKTLKRLTGDDDFDSLASRFTDATEKLAAIGRDISALKIRKDRLDAIPARLAESDTKAREATEKKTALDALQATDTEKLGRLTGSVEELESSLEYKSESDARKAIGELTDRYNAWASAMDSRKKALDDIQKRLSASRGKREALIESLEKQSSLLKERQVQMESALSDNGFLNEGEYIKALRDSKYIKDKTSQVDEYIRDKQINSARLEELNKKLAGLSRRPLQALDAQLAEQKAVSRRTLDEISVIERRALSNSETSHEIRVENEIFIRYSNEYSISKRVSDLVTGVGSSERDKISLVRYVQSRLFDEVLIKANQRFAEMSSGQFKLIRNDSSADKRQKVGLELDVENLYNGKRRQASSLSGGESFMASLSLALGFADVIREQSGGVVVDCLFVDEGFGSLDPAALDTVINVVLKLSGDDKLIGLISHVEQLRERIYRQIHVTRTREGSRAVIR